MTDIDELRSELEEVLRPEPDEDGFVSREFPVEDLQRDYGLDVSYLKGSLWEGSTSHRDTRIIPAGHPIAKLNMNQGVPHDLLEAALRIFADSIAAYNDRDDRSGDLRYYPPVILTFWSGFEAFLRFQSTLLVNTARELPEEVSDFLMDRRRFITEQGDIETKPIFNRVLSRYLIFLRYGYSLRGLKGDRFWQRLDAARRLRDYYTHIDIDEVRSVSATEVLDFMEAVILAIIEPSCRAKRTLMLGAYRIYNGIRVLREHYADFVERPFFMTWAMDREPFMTHCNFVDVDASQFPNSREQLKLRGIELPDTSEHG